MKAVGADVSPRVIEDLPGRATGDQLLQTRDLQRMVHARVQLAVGIRSGTPLAEQQVRFGIRHARAVEAYDVGAAPFQRRPAVDQVAGNAVGGQDQRGVQARWAGADHNRAGLALSRPRSFHAEVAGRGSLDDPARAPCGRESAASERGIHDQVRMHDETQSPGLSATAGVNRLASDPEAAQRFEVDSGDGHGTLAQHALGFVEAQLEIQHPPGACRSTHGLLL